MKPEDQRIAIHQALGYKLTRTSMGTYWEKPEETLALSDFMRGTTTPDYLADLNAMHEAEKLLNIPENMRRHAWNNYKACLDEMTRGSGFHATAPQRAEAFRHTLGL